MSMKLTSIILLLGLFIGCYKEETPVEDMSFQEVTDLRKPKDLVEFDLIEVDLVNLDQQLGDIAPALDMSDLNRVYLQDLIDWYKIKFREEYCTSEYKSLTFKYCVDKFKTFIVIIGPLTKVECGDVLYDAPMYFDCK